MFEPVIPISGYGGWKFLQSTYSRQLESFSDSAQIRNDRDYLLEKFSEPLSVESFLDDRRLLRIALTSVNLGGEEWKRGYIDKVLSEVGDPDSTFLARLNNPQYSSFAKAFEPTNGFISISSEALTKIAVEFETASFGEAVGEVDLNMRLSLTYQSEIVDLAGSGASEEATLFRLLGNIPVRTILEGALNLSSEMRILPIERQAVILQERLESVLGIRDLSELTSIDKIDKVIQRFHTIQAISQGPSGTGPGSVALALLNGSVGFGSAASQNSFLSTLF